LETSAAVEVVLSERDMMEIERSNPEGLTSAQIIKIFQARGARLSEATFRKYVQLGLLPRSKRVGAKGKHRGSHGIYPCATVRRINSIKQLMSQSFTIEQIQHSFSSFKTRIEEIESALEELFRGFERDLAQPSFDNSRRRVLARDVDLAKRTAGDLVRRLIQLESQIAWPLKSQRVANAGTLSELHRQER
jgi:hypothetical protein